MVKKLFSGILGVVLLASGMTFYAEYINARQLYKDSSLVFLGTTCILIGLLFLIKALKIFLTDEKFKKCPFCSEKIQKDAIKCRYCNEFLVPDKSKDINSKQTEQSVQNIPTKKGQEKGKSSVEISKEPISIKESNLTPIKISERSFKFPNIYCRCGKKLNPVFEDDGSISLKNVQFVCPEYMSNTNKHDSLLLDEISEEEASIIEQDRKGLLLSSTEKPSFKIGIINSILVIAACITALIFFLLEKNFTACQLGELIGTCAGFCAGPFIGGWIFWRLTKRNNTIGRVAFFIVFLYSLYIYIPGLTKEYQQGRAVKKMGSIVSELDKEIINDIKQYGQFDPNLGEKLEKFGQKFIQAIPKRTDEEKAIAEVGQEFFNRIGDLSKKCDEAKKKFLNELSSFPAVETPEEINRKINILKGYRKSLNELFEFGYGNGGKNLCEQKLKDKGVSEEEIIAFVAGMEKSMADTKDISIRLYSIKNKYIDSLLIALYFLDKNFGRWEYSHNTNQILFYDDSFLNKFNELIKEILQNEEHFYILEREMYSILTQKNQ